MATDIEKESLQNTSQQASYREIAASHIRTLSTASTTIPSIVNAAATAFSQLTNAPIPLSPDSPDTLDDRKAAIADASDLFYNTVRALGAVLHDQITKLELQGVIPAKEEFKAPPPPPPPDDIPGQSKQPRPPPPPKDPEASVTNSGLGNFDIGVLNARAHMGQKGGDDVLERLTRILEDLGKHVEETKEEDMDIEDDG